MTATLGVVDAHFAQLLERHPQATIELLPDGTARVSVPGLPLGPLWNQPFTTVHFLVPVGYPVAPPDCFWADPTLTLLGGGTPMNANLTPPPWTPSTHLWFSYHVQQGWKPTRDSLTTYVHVIQARLHEGR